MQCANFNWNKWLGLRGAAVTVAAALGSLMVLAAELPDDASGTLAAWIQAFGSIFAIAVAYLVGARQSQSAIEAVEAAQRGELESRKCGLFAVVQAAFDQTEAISLVMNREIPRESLHEVYNRVVTQRYIRALETLPLFEIGAKGGVAAILSMRDQFLFLEEALELYIAGPWKHPELRKTLDSLIPYEEKQQLSSALDRANAVLVHNVRVHLAEIARNYKLVRDSMLAAPRSQS